MNTWPAPVKGTMCPLRIPRCFSPQDIETPDFDATWVAPNPTAMAHVLLRLLNYRKESNIPLRIIENVEENTIRVMRMP